MDKNQEKLQEQSATVYDIFFNRFGTDEYVLVPFNNKFARWIHRNSPSLFVVLFLAVVLLSVIIYFQAEDRQDVSTLMKMQGNYPVKTYLWCFDENDSGERNYLIYLREDNHTCLDIQTKPIVSYEDGLFSQKEMIAANSIRVSGRFSIPIMISAFLSIIVLRKVESGFPKALIELAKAGRIIPPSDLNPDDTDNLNHSNRFGNVLKMKKLNFVLRPKNWKTYPDDMKNAIKSRWGGFFFFVLLIFCSVFMLRLIHQLNVFNNFWKGLLLGTQFILGLFLIAFNFGYGTWTMIVISNFIRWLSPVYKLDIQPEHGDRCGGLKRLGNVCFELASIIIFPTVVMGSFLLFGFALAPAFRTLIAITLPAASTIAAITFFWPLIDIHKLMLVSRDNYLDEAILRISKLRDDLRQFINRGESRKDEVLELERQLELTRLIYPISIKYPTWPFSVTSPAVIIVSQIFSFLPLVATILDISAHIPRS